MPAAKKIQKSKSTSTRTLNAVAGAKSGTTKKTKKRSTRKSIKHGGNAHLR